MRLARQAPKRGRRGCPPYNRKVCQTETQSSALGEARAKPRRDGGRANPCRTHRGVQNRARRTDHGNSTAPSRSRDQPARRARRGTKREKPRAVCGGNTPLHRSEHRCRAPSTPPTERRPPRSSHETNASRKSPAATATPGRATFPIKASTVRGSGSTRTVRRRGNSARRWFVEKIETQSLR